MSREERENARALLPSLHFLAAEALRAGCAGASQVILNAISHIETMVADEGKKADEQRHPCPSRPH